jgi:hypothetical protein
MVFGMFVQSLLGYASPRCGFAGLLNVVGGGGEVQRSPQAAVWEVVPLMYYVEYLWRTKPTNFRRN